jgi:hypothetical protein
MRIIKLFTLLTLITSCSNPSKQENKTASEIEILKNIKVLTNIKYKIPIITFKKFADSGADKSIRLSKKNIASSLTKAKKYKYCIITVGTHTIVKALNLTNCKQSRAWGTCMPFAEGYIKKGVLEYKKDFINNIIGLPDNQERIMYLFK